MKELIYTTIGVISITNDKFKELLEDLIQNNDYTQDEGKRIVDNFLYNLRQQIDTTNANLSFKVDELLQKLGIPTLHSIQQDFENYVNDVKENPSILLRLPSKK